MDVNYDKRSAAKQNRHDAISSRRFGDNGRGSGTVPPSIESQRS